MQKLRFGLGTAILGEGRKKENERKLRNNQAENGGDQLEIAMKE